MALHQAIALSALFVVNHTKVWITPEKDGTSDEKLAILCGMDRKSVHSLWRMDTFSHCETIQLGFNGRLKTSKGYYMLDDEVYSGIHSSQKLKDQTKISEYFLIRIYPSLIIFLFRFISV